MQVRIISVLLMVAMLLTFVSAVSAEVIEDFDPALDLSLWALIQNGEVAPDPCGFVSSPNALQMRLGQTFKSARAALVPGGFQPRIAETIAFDVSGGGSIEFDFIQPLEGGRPKHALFGTRNSCEESNDDERVDFQYSTNGSTWTTIVRLPLSEDFTHFTISIPAAAQTGNTAFRWIQEQYDGSDGPNCCDVWALDNVLIPTGGSSVGADGSIVGPPCNNLFDGRINDDQALDCGAPVAIYYAGDANGRIDVYAIDPNDGDGVLIISVPAQVVESTPTGGQVEVSGNYLLGSAVNPATGVLIELYWLPATGEYLLRTTYSNGKLYEVIWSNADDLRHTSA